MALSGAGWVLASVPDKPSAATLQGQYTALGERLSHNQYQRALYLDSSESADKLTGDLYVLVDFSFTAVSAALHGPEQWCEVLILPINTRFCHATGAGPRAALTVSIGKKQPHPPEDAYAIAFASFLGVVPVA